MKNKIHVSMISLLIVTVLAAAGCERDSNIMAMNEPRMDYAPVMRIAGESGQKERNPYLAYEHSVSIEVEEETLEASFLNTIAKCIDDKANACVIHHSELNTGDYPSANIQVRIKKDGVAPFIQTASENNKITEQTVSAEDLAAPIMDNEKRLKMLESYQKRLIELESQSAKDIESLIKVASEIAKTQSDLEAARGDNEHLLKRINMDIVSIHFHTDPEDSILEPISKAVRSFAYNLSEGIASVFIFSAFLIPWVLVLIGLYYLWRWWRKKK